MLRDSSLPSKDTVWQTRLKRRWNNFCFQEIQLITETNIALGWKGERRFNELNSLPKQAGVAIVIKDKVDFKSKLVRRDKEGHCILIKGAIQDGNNNC
jgi:hypothetical protein